VERAEFDRMAAFLYSDEEDTPAVALNDKLDRAVMEERRNELLAVQESIAAAKGREKIGTVMEVLVDGPSEETEHLLQGRHQGLAPEIDGVVYINDGLAAAGDRVKVEITDSGIYDLVGHILS